MLCAEGDQFSPIQSSLSDNLSNKTVRDGMFGLGMAPKRMVFLLSRLFNPFNLKILDLYLKMWLWSPMICANKALHAGVDIWDYVKIYTFNNFVFFNTFYFFNIIIILLFLLVYMTLLPLFSLIKLILSSFLPLLFFIIIY